MSGIGAQLTAARESRGLTIAEAAARLHIRPMYVAALEREEWLLVGEPVYARGFLKNYARLLNVDADAALHEIDSAYAALSADTPAAFERYDGGAFAASGRRQGRWFSWLLATMTAIAAVLVALVAWSMFGTVSANRKATPAAVSPAQSAATPPGSGPQLNGVSQHAPAALPPGVNLRLQLTQDAWLSVSVDGKRELYETLPAGTVKEFHGVRAITLRTGNAGGVTATVDGQELGKLGSVGQVEDRVFAVKPAPAATGTHE